MSAYKKIVKTSSSGRGKDALEPFYTGKTASSRSKIWPSQTFPVLGLLLFFAFLLILLPIAGLAAVDCNIIAQTDVNFGSYDVLSPLNTDSAGSLTVDCNGQSWTWVNIYIGASPTSGGFNPRKMPGTPSGDMLNYNLFRDSARSEIWGDGSGGTYYIRANIQKNRPQTFPIYGRIPPGQNVGVGNYGEILVITILY